MNTLLKGAKILVCVGTGGVGKTTVAASLGAMASEEGLRVLVLTIDPAQRLKTILGLTDEGDIQDVVHPRAKARFSAALINSKRTFDDFVLRASNHSEKAKKILNNKLYIQLSTTLSGSQEFTALEKLYSVYESGEYDLIVLDTPPSKHAMDFLKAPQKLSALFQEGITKWFRDPKKGSGGLLVSIFQTGTKQVLKALELLTGSEFMSELSAFFSGIQDWQAKLEERTVEVHRLLVDPRTQFFLVCSYDRAKLAEAGRFGREIRKSGYHLKSIILNRAFPTWLPEWKDRSIPQTSGSSLAEKWKKMIQERRKNSEVLIDMQKNQVKILELPELSEDISDLDGIFAMADRIKGAQ